MGPSIESPWRVPNLRKPPFYLSAGVVKDIANSGSRKLKDCLSQERSDVNDDTAIQGYWKIENNSEALQRVEASVCYDREGFPVSNPLSGILSFPQLRATLPRLAILAFPTPAPGFIDCYRFFTTRPGITNAASEHQLAGPDWSPLLIFAYMVKRERSHTFSSLLCKLSLFTHSDGRDRNFVVRELRHWDW